jgi:hypothetical protein
MPPWALALRMHALYMSYFVREPGKELLCPYTNFLILTETKNVSGQGCGVPVRDRGASFFTIGVVGMAVAIIAYLLRLGASLPKKGRPISWDDATMGLVVAFAIPPAVFAWFCKSLRCTG